MMSRLIRIYSAILISPEIPVWNNGYDQIQGWKSPLQKLRDERVKSEISIATVYLMLMLTSLLQVGKSCPSLNLMLDANVTIRA